MAGNQSKAVVVMIRGLGKIQYFERRGPWFKPHTSHLFSFFVVCFGYNVSFQNKTKQGNYIRRRVDDDILVFMLTIIFNNLSIFTLT